jgi:hypothetical protein
MVKTATPVGKDDFCGLKLRLARSAAHRGEAKAHSLDSDFRWPESLTFVIGRQPTPRPTGACRGLFF